MNEPRFYPWTAECVFSAALESTFQAIKDKATVKSSKKSAVEENFHDVVDLDERHVEEFVAEQFVNAIVESKPFQAFSLVVVFLQAAITGARTDRSIVSVGILCIIVERINLPI